MWIAIAALATVLGGFFVVVPRLAPRPVEDPTLTVLGATVLSLAALVAVFCATSRVVADEDGMRWKRLGFGGSVLWSDVHEYHLQDTQGAARKPSLVIQTEAGRLVIPDLWTHQADLRALLADRAITRLEDECGVLSRGPVTEMQRAFEYDARRIRVARLAFITGITLCLGLAFHHVPAKLVGVFTDLGPLMTCAMLLLALAVAGSMAAFVYCSFIIALNDGLRRRGQRVLVDTDGIAFEDGLHTVRANWEDVLSVSRRRLGNMAYGMKRVIVTTGGEFEYTHVIRDAMRLDAVILRFAENAGPVKLMESEDEDLAKLATVPGVGVYHYRTRTNRALLMFPLGFVLIAAVIGVLQTQGLAEHSNQATPWVMGLGSFAVWAIGFWRYRSVTIRTDALGITWTGPSRRTVVPWSDVQSFRLRGSDVSRYGEVIASRATIRFWIGISECEKLKEEIESHVTR